MLDETDIIKRITRGDQRALEHLYHQYSEIVYNTLISYTKNAEEAEELLQDVFVSIYDTAHKFRFDSSLSTWIYRITVNKALDFLRKKNTAKRKGILSSLYRKDSGELQYDQSHFDHPGVKMENVEDARYLFQALSELSENQKTVFILTQIEQLSQQEVADIMQVTRKAVESLLQRAKANLRGILEKHYPERVMALPNASK
ncbi:MAG: RNA polymerase sigma factor [Cyclobacteriaceae bacterium]